MKILIYGAGALGQAVGCMLAVAGHEVDLILRQRFAEAIGRQDLAVTGIFGEYRAGAADLGLHSTIDPVLHKPFDYAIITTKSYDTAAAADDLKKLTCNACVMVSMQNGCGNLELLVESFGAARSLGARVITGFEIPEPGLVRITVSADAVHIGSYEEGQPPPAAVRLATAIDKAGLPCMATGQIRRDLLAKLLYNSALNPLGAILGVHYGALGDDADTRTIMDKVIAESFAVFEAMGEKTHWETPEEYGGFFYDRQLPVTYGHRSSMLQDIENGKRTEVEAFTGYVSVQGHRYGVPTPACDLLSALVRFKERQGLHGAQRKKTS